MNKAKIKYMIFALIAILSFSALLGLSAMSFALLPSAPPYSNVQVFVQTASSLPDYFTVSAFNMSGYMVASSQTQYPAASFELPNGQYIFTVTADESSDLIYYAPSPTVGVNVAQGNPAMPYYEAPVVEYGYAIQQVSGPTTFTISTQNVTSFPTTTLTITVVYANGTAAEGATVSASVVGSWYYWGYEPNAVLWNTTQADGTATLVTPQAPVQIDAWNWIPVIPSNLTTVTVIVGGEEVNVTVYWQPTYVGLAGSTLIVPPQTSASITLHVQQPDYWVMPLAVQVAPATGGEATTSSSPSSIPATVYQQQQGNPILTNYQAPTSPTSTTPTNPAPTSSANSGFFTGSNLPLTIIASTALAVAALSLAFAARTQRRKPKDKQ